MAPDTEYAIAIGCAAMTAVCLLAAFASPVRILSGIAGILFGTGALVVYLAWRDDRDLGGALTNVYIFDDEAAPVAVTLDRSSIEDDHDHYGLTVLDLSKGARIARLDVREDLAVLGRTGDYFWLKDGQDVAEYRPMAGKLPIVATLEEVRGRIGQKDAKLASLHDLSFVPSARKLHATTNDGHGYWVDPLTLAATPSESDFAPGGGSLDEVRIEQTMRVDLGGGAAMELKGEARRQLVAHAAGGGQKVAEARFLMGYFLQEAREPGAPRVLDDPPSAIVVTAATLDEKAPLSFARVTPDGSARWTVTQEEMGCAGRKIVGARLVGQMLVVFGAGADPRKGSARNCAAGIDLLAGRVAWKAEL